MIDGRSGAFIRSVHQKQSLRIKPNKTKKKKKGYAEAGNARNDGNNRIRIGREQQKVKKKTNKSRRETTF